MILQKYMEETTSSGCEVEEAQNNVPKNDHNKTLKDKKQSAFQGEQLVQKCEDKRTWS